MPHDKPRKISQAHITKVYLQKAKRNHASTQTSLLLFQHVSSSLIVLQEKRPTPIKKWS